MSHQVCNYDSNQINSALVVYRPVLKGFFYSKLMDVFIRNIISHLVSWKTVKQVINLETTYGVSGLFMLPYTLRDLKRMSQVERENEVKEAVSLAINKGAKKIALAGQLASCLNYCESFLNEDLKREKIKLQQAIL